MKLVLTTLVLLVSSVLRSSSAAGATLQLPSNLWENSTTQINCASDTVGYDINNITEVRFWKVDNSDVYFVYTKSCGSNAFTVANDTTGGRIAFTTSTTVPTWVNLTSQDSGSYKCSLVSCSEPSKVEVSDSVGMTVHKYNTAPLLVSPIYTEIGTTAGVYTEYNFICAGFTGYPPGSLRLVEVRGNYLRDFTLNSTTTILYSNATIDSSGNATLNVNHTIRFESIDVNYIYCETYKAVGSVAVALQSRKVNITGFFRPVISYRLRKSTEASHTDYFDKDADIYINDVGNFELMCYVSSNPVSDVTFLQTSGPNAQLKDLTLKTVSIVNENKDTLSVLKFLCSTVYQALSISPFETYNGTVTVYLNYGDPNSGIIATSSSVLLLLALAVLQFLR